MAGRTRNNTNRIETDIEKSREESNWKKVIELAEQLKLRSKNYECLSNFLIGEGKLECYLEEWPPVEANKHRAKTGLVEAKQFLQEAANDLGKKAGVALDAHLLLGKLFYACGEYTESLNNYNLAELHTLTEKNLPIRSLRIVAESFAIKGICLERERPAGSRFKQAEREAEVIKCFELASDLSLLYLQEIDKIPNTSVQGGLGSHSPLPTVAPNRQVVGPIMELALQRAPILHISAGRLAAAVERYRTMLCAVESASTTDLRLTFSRQLAEVLLRGVTGPSYVTPDRPSLQNNTKKILSMSSNGYSETPWKPRRYTSINQFIPRNENEEVILLLLISEAMAVHNAVLSQSPEFREARIRAYENATAVYDLLTLATVRWGQVALLHESFERAMKFSFEEPHVWHQEALCLINMGRYNHALVVLKEVTRLQPTQVPPCLLAAKLCYDNLSLHVKGTEWSLMALEREQASPQGLIGRCHIYIGIGYQLQAAAAQLKTQKNILNHQAIEAFQKAIQDDPNDHLAEYYMGLQLALMGDRIPDALTHVRASLSLRPEGSAALQLLALLLSASRQHGDALRLIMAALEEYPDSLNLMHVKAHLQLHELGSEAALATAKKMLELWKSQYENLTIPTDIPDFDKKSDTRSVFQLYTSEMSDKDTSSLQAHSIAASRVEQALSEAASSLSSFSPRPGPQRAWQLQMQVWLLLAELYLATEQLNDAQECVKKASDIYPLSHHIMHMRGLIHMKKEEWIEAKLCFLNAVSVNPRYIRSLQELGLVYHYLGAQRVAETTLREAAGIDPRSHNTWYILGKVLESMGEYEGASNCMATALAVEKTSPILPFSSVPLCFE